LLEADSANTVICRTIDTLGETGFSVRNEVRLTNRLFSKYDIHIPIGMFSEVRK